MPHSVGRDTPTNMSAGLRPLAKARTAAQAAQHSPGHSTTHAPETSRNLRMAVAGKALSTSCTEDVPSDSLSVGTPQHHTSHKTESALPRRDPQPQLRKHNRPCIVACVNGEEHT